MPAGDTRVRPPTLLGNRILTARGPRVTPHDPPRGVPEPADETVPLECLGGVLGAGRDVPTGGGKEWGDRALVRANEQNQCTGRYLGSSRRLRVDGH